MFVVNDDMSIYLTRGDTAIFSVTADNNGKNYVFQPGDVVRMKVTEKKACENVIFQKDFPVTEEAEKVDILLTEEETKIGEVISKPTDYWYEIELNPYTNPQTIVGYDEDGAKILRLFPEGIDLEPTPIEPTDIPVVDSALSLTSDRPVQNQAISRAITGLGADIKYVRDSGSERMATIEGKIAAEASRRSEDVLRLENDIAVERARINSLASLEDGSTTGDAELADIRVGADGKTYTNAGEAVRGQIGDLKSDLSEFDFTNIKGAEIGVNLFNKYNVKRGYFLNHNNGNIAQNNSYCAGDYIEVHPSTPYFSNLYYHHAWYDENKVFISGGDTPINGESPNNAKYLRCDVAINDIDKLQIFEGTKRSGLIPFKTSFPWLYYDVDLSADDFNKYGAYFVNLFNKDTAFIGGYVSEANGEFLASSTYFRSAYIEIEPNTSYRIADVANRVAFYTERYEFIEGMRFNTVSAVFTTPANAKYIVVCSSPLTAIDTLMIAKEEYFSSNYESYGIVVPWLKTSAPKSKYEGKTIVCFGDSITHMGYTDTITADTGMKAVNMGFSSARYAYSDDSNEIVNSFALHNLVDSIVSGDWSIPDKVIGVSGYETHASQLERLKATDFNSVDFVSFAYGTNDFSSSTPMDNPDDKYDVNYFKGAMRYSIKKFMEAYPHIKVIVSTPIYRFWVSNGAVVDDCDTHTIGGFLLSDYTNAEKEVCDELHIPYVDNLSNGGINAFNRLNYFSLSDSLHPNDKGRAMIGHRIGNGILANY